MTREEALEYVKKEAVDTTQAGLMVFESTAEKVINALDVDLEHKEKAFDLLYEDICNSGTDIIQLIDMEYCIDVASGKEE